jgi:hypothetical protein
MSPAVAQGKLDTFVSALLKINLIWFETSGGIGSGAEQ